jgi:hypothetical protein
LNVDRTASRRTASSRDVLFPATEAPSPKDARTPHS